jgi:hypothetical protein
MPMSFRKAKTALCLLPLVATLGGAPREAPQPTLRVRVSNETSPGAGDFDSNVLGFIEALNTDGSVASFYRYNCGRYGNTAPVLTPNASHLFFVNGSDGVALFVVHHAPNRNTPQFSGWGGSVKNRFELSGGTASILVLDDGGTYYCDDQPPDTRATETFSSEGGTVFATDMYWPNSNTDGTVIGTLPVGFTILGQFTAPPRGLDGGWKIISADGTVYSLKIAPGQRIRLDVRLTVDVEQGQP